jgi:molecular chaperone GrpE (heat shock protein)
MARGWESKAVGDQIETAAVDRPSGKSKAISPAQARILRERKILELSRKRVARDLENSQDPRYRSLLMRALEDLDAKLAGIAQAG